MKQVFIISYLRSHDSLWIACAFHTHLFLFNILLGSSFSAWLPKLEFRQQATEAIERNYPRFEKEICQHAPEMEEARICSSIRMAVSGQPGDNHAD